MIMGSPKKMGASSKYSLNFSASIVALEMRSFNSGRNRAMSLDWASGVTSSMVQQHATYLDQCKENICAQRSFMRLVNDQRRITSQVGLCQELSQEHSVSHVFEDRLIACRILKSDRIPDFVPHLGSHLLCNTGSNRHGGHTTRLCTADFHPTSCVTGFVQVLGELSRFARSSLGYHY